MQPEPANSQPIAYSRTLYVGGYRYRSLAGICGLFLGAMLSIASIWALSYSPIGFLRPVVIVFSGILMTVHVIWMMRDHQLRFSIETAGIVDRDRFVPWSEVKRFAAEGQAGGTNLTLFYVTTSSWIPHSLISSRRLRTPEYEQLLDQLRASGLNETFPKLQFGGYEGA